jgi:hypothetical protein
MFCSLLIAMNCFPTPGKYLARELRRALVMKAAPSFYRGRAGLSSRSGSLRMRAREPSIVAGQGKSKAHRG